MLRKHTFSFTLALFFLLGIGYCYYTPLWNTPDEERHFAYCEYIAQHHTLPEYRLHPQGNSVGMACHPPLYYITASLFFGNDSGLLEELLTINDEPGFTTVIHKPNTLDDLYAKKARVAYRLRFLSLLLGGVTLWCLYKTALTLFPGDIIFATICMVFVATIPQFLHISTSVTNDSITIAASSAYILSFLSFIKDPAKIMRQILCGILLGLCLLSKTSTIIFIPATLCFVCFFCLKRKENPARAIIVIMGTAALVFGWWYLRNWFLYDDPMLSKTAFANNPLWTQTKTLTIDYWKMVFARTFVSYFGDFGSLQFTISNTHLTFYGTMLFLSCIGICRMLASKKTSPYQTQALYLFSLICFCQAGLFFYLNIKYIGFFMGRYIYIVIIPTTILCFWGLRILFPNRLKTYFFIFLAGCLITLNLYALFGVVKPAYAKTFLQKAIDQSEFYCSTPKLKNATTIGQSFICPSDNLCAIRIMVLCENKPVNGELEFILKEATDGMEELYRIPLSFKVINDFNRYCFFFPPIKGSAGKRFVFYFAAPDRDVDISLGYDTNNSYQEGSFQLNNKPLEGDLYFQAYCFTGTQPKTDWQGQRAIAMDQGWYVTIRELQLYEEQSPEFRVKTETHTKLLRLEKAFNYRKKLSAGNLSGKPEGHSDKFLD